ncbi:MAG: ABC transporter ATP-binding protein, partial [Candidatus Methylumidiphilus sp.]
MANRLELAKASIAHGGQMLIRDVSLRLGAGRIGCLLGPGACGKSSLLRAIAGFEPLAQGAIHIDDARVSSPETHISPELRGLGMVFPDCALFPHLTVGQNVAFGLRKLGGKEQAKRLVEAMHKVGLRDLREMDSRYPHQLTGEQQMRVALARALAPRPRLLLLDDPFARLDRSQQERLPAEIRDILKEAEVTALLATQDQSEALAMADEIGVMSTGRLLQWGDAESIYQRPANRFVANYVGQGAILTVQMALGVGIISEIGALPL